MRFNATLKVLLVVGLLFFGLRYLLTSSGNSLKPQQVAAIDREEEDNRQEEILERIKQEVLMTKDPVLGYVPKEELIGAELRANQMMAAVQMNNPQALLPWAERGPSNMGGRSRSVLIDQADATGNTVFVGSVSGGLWRTTNFKAGTPTWTQISSVSANLAITTLAQDPSNFSIMYAGTGEGYFNFDAVRGLGIYKSVDGGATWSLLASTTTGGTNVGDFSYVQKILVYTNGDVYASGISAQFCNNGGVLKSTNGGNNWTRVIGTFTGCGNCGCAFDFYGYDIEMSASGDLYASVVDRSVFPPADTTFGKILKSPAGGTVGNAGTWVDISPSPSENEFWQRIDIACAPSNNNVVYAIAQGPGSAIDSIFRSDNGGTTWIGIDNTTLWCDQGTSSSVDFSRNQAWYDLIIAVKPDDAATVFAGGVDIMKSTNSGGLWVQNTQWNAGCGVLPVIHADIHNIVYLPGTTNEFIVVNDGGIYYTNDNGNTYSNKSSGFNTIQYYANAIHPTSGSNYMLGGSQDNGSHRFTAAGLGTVSTATGGDGGFCFIDQDDPTYQITSFTGSSYRVSRDAGVNFNVAAGFGGADRFINPADYDNTFNLLYAASDTGKFIRINNITGPGGVTGSKFTLIAPPNGTNFSVSAVKVDPIRTDTIWFAFSISGSAVANVVPRLYRINNASTGSPTATQFVLPSGAGQFVAGSYISSIDVDPSDKQHMLITLSNYGVTSVWESTDGATTWTSVEGNLPNFPVRWGMFVPAGFNPGSGTNAIGGVMLATELGIWSTSALTAGTTTWIPNNTAMGNVRTDMLRLRNSDKVVMAASHGRGAFTATLFTSLPVDFVSFTGKVEDRVNKLKWKVENEVDNSGYEIQRKYKGESDFVKIGWVPAKTSSTLSNEYSFDDGLVDLGKDIASYRLKQFDIDQRYSYSNIISLQRKTSGKFVEYAAVSGNQLLIRINGGNNDQLSLRLFDISGRLLKKSSIMNKTQYIDISTLSRGAFVVDIVHPDGRRFTKKMVY